ncbi:hypothetical protein A2454_02740 [Candidatus Peribacteria bacterium RIFOXYC2_FULL_55_14]|nr:MAG: hypothetical protein UY87_C0066G0007 [Candidatus Peribacteria bacterium GW2011_GWC2_54_8]KKW42341.1 MAG: hypothetical protein UY90_C0039G0008 [Candidatus Peregrinibacteria bacterium GW2011_GWA2_54_9]OGJ73726.1 MAG: hypothetical protein A2384_04065 [Candidatus Peribacteria bacterium RIFOXYB1_FULL_54_35]OGJ74854.1 MAG: hypothetical protein A2217_02535 [Candidatus Peribacteria bacterium RIFOXYA2_FULL_55_28]OGJ77142.1 MAG: hypothetical protein A2327_05640 [Candidatus Peribacteria bacterium 
MAKSSEPLTNELSKENAPFPFSAANHTGMSEHIPLAPVPSVKVIAHNYNVTQKLITVTEDKALICLQRNLKMLGKRRWIHPLSLLITMLLALATSDFSKLTWMSSELLKATFMVTSSLTAAWLVWEIMHEGKLKELPEAISDIFVELRD